MLVEASREISRQPAAEASEKMGWHSNLDWIAAIMMVQELGWTTEQDVVAIFEMLSDTVTPCPSEH